MQELLNSSSSYVRNSWPFTVALQSDQQEFLLLYCFVPELLPFVPTSSAFGFAKRRKKSVHKLTDLCYQVYQHLLCRREVDSIHSRSTQVPSAFFDLLVLGFQAIIVNLAFLEKTYFIIKSINSLTSNLDLFILLFNYPFFLLISILKVFVGSL